MKISNRIGSPALSTRINRLKTDFESTPMRRVPVATHHVPSANLHPKETNLSAKRLRIQNFSFYAPAARRVQLVGNFTHWLEQPINLRKSPQGTWWKAVRLGTGTYYYRFLVDGQWCDDPDCSLFAPNPYGSQNAVRHVH